MRTLHSPEALLLIIPLMLAYVWYFLNRKTKIATVQVSHVAFFKNMRPSIKMRIKYLPEVLAFIAALFAIYALSRPQEGDSKVKKNIEGIDIVIALDVSDSMLIEDMQPNNRLEAAKETIRKFIEKRSSDRIGLVVFAGEAFTQVPPTLDYQLILSRTDEITTAANAKIKDGTAIGVALASAAGRLKDSQAKSRVVIFMTDGENNTGTIDPETGLEVAKGYGIKIYSIGIGKDGPTRLPIYQTDVFGRKVKTYQPFHSTVNEDLLNKMASDTGGKFYRASTENALEKVFSDIDKLEKTKVDVDRYMKYTDKFQPYLLTAIILFLLSLLTQQAVLRRVP